MIDADDEDDSGGDDSGGDDVDEADLDGDFEVAGIILRCRRSADLSQRDLAARLGVCPSAVARWETGSRMPGADMLARIAELAGYRLGLIDGEEQPVSAAPSETLRDRGGRRMPAHLDVHLWDEYRWQDAPQFAIVSGGRSLRSVHAPRRGWRDLRRAHLSARPVERAPGCAPFHSLGLARWCHDITTARDYTQWREAQALAREALLAKMRANSPPVPEPEPCFCEIDCFEHPGCLPECECQCELVTRVVA